MLADSMRTRATYSWMLAVFAGLALVLALGGAYGVTSYLVTQRTREIGIRMAMGARSRDIVRSVLQGSLVAIGIGVAVGLAARRSHSPGCSRDILFGVSPRDPAVLAGATLALASGRRARQLDSGAASSEDGSDEVVAICRYWGIRGTRAEVRSGADAGALFALN